MLQIEGFGLRGGRFSQEPFISQSRHCPQEGAGAAARRGYPSRM